MEILFLNKMHGYWMPLYKQFPGRLFAILIIINRHTGIAVSKVSRYNQKNKIEIHLK